MKFKNHMKQSIPVFLQGESIPCPKCGEKLILDRSGDKILYFKCSKCNRGYKSERIRIDQNVLRLWPSQDAKDWLQGKGKAILDAAVNIIRKMSGNGQEADSMPLSNTYLAPYIRSKDSSFPNEEEALAFAFLEADIRLPAKVFIDENEASSNPIRHQKETREALDQAISDALSEEDQKKILRFVFYSCMLKDNRMYSKVLDSKDKASYAISRSIKPVRRNTNKRRKISPSIPET